MSPLPRTSSVSLTRFTSVVLSYVLLVTLSAPLTRTTVAKASAPRAASPAASLANQSGQQSGAHRSGEVLVRFQPGVTEAEKNAIAAGKGARRGRHLRGASRFERLESASGETSEVLARQLATHPSVELVEPNYLITRDDLNLGKVPNYMPGYPRDLEQWKPTGGALNTGAGQMGVGLLAAPDPWQTAGVASPQFGAGMLVAVIDSGVDFTHPGLSANRWENPSEQSNNRDDDRDGYVDDLHGWDWVADSNQIRDEQGHGTSVAGLIVAEVDRAAGATGVARRASLMSLRVLDNTGTGDVADAVEAIDYAVARGAQVLNLSWGLEAGSLALRDAIESASRRGVIVVCSAGNNGRNIDSAPYYPASYELQNLVAVAASDSADNLTSWSNWGATRVTVAAPGVDVSTTKMGGGEQRVSGTSAAAPQVSGIAGLVKSSYPGLSAADTRTAIVKGARQVAELSGKVLAGGVAQAAGAISAAGGMGTGGTGDRGNGNGGDNVNNGDGNGGNNNSGGNGQLHRGVPQPGRAERGSGGRGPGGSFDVTPPEVVKGAPRQNLPNLDELRKLKSHVPQPPSASTTISANLLCADCDPGSGGGYVPPGDPLYSTARTEPRNETGQAGVDLGSQNFNWSTPLLGLKGRAGLDFGLSLSYNSLVWTKQDHGIKFNADRGFPGPGFRLGFPTLQPRYYNSQAATNAYMMVTPAGERVELRQLGGANSHSNTYEAADGSNRQLVEFYQIISRHNGRCLDVSGAGVHNGARLTQWDCVGVQNQQWQLVPTDSGYYRIMARHSAKAVDVEGAYTADGAAVHQWSYVGGANQQWQLVPTDSGYYRIVARHSGKVLEVIDGSYNNGAPVGQQTYWGSEWQQWRLAPAGGQMVVRAPDGMQYTFAHSANGEYKCTQVKDRNGNYITINYDGLGHPTSVVDTVGRTINFTYDSNQNLYSITQLWNGTQHVWASFTYDSLYLQGNFPGLSVNGPNYSHITVLKQVWQHDGSRYDFNYNSWGQVNRITKYAADGHPLNYTSYNLPADSSVGQSDCPRFTESRDWAENWNGGAEVAIGYAAAADGSWSQVTMPDGTIHKEFFATTGWQKGLTTLSEAWSGGVRKKWTILNWTQDDTNLTYQKNPRPAEINVHDAEGNRKRTTFSYTSFGLPSDTREYAADGVTVLRRTHVDYNFDTLYVDRRIIGLPGVNYIYEGESTLLGKTEYHYDWGGEYFSAQAPSVQHDSGNYHSGFLGGRGNLSAVRRFNKDAPGDANQAHWQQITAYNMAGLPVWQNDGEGHRTNISYADSYSDGVNSRNTLAYPTTVTDPDGHASFVQYNYHVGAVTRTQGPPPAGQTQGVVQTMEYDAVGRIERVTTVNNGAYSRWVYPAYQNYILNYTTVQEGAGEAYSGVWFDGAGRVLHNLSALPNSTGGYSLDVRLYDTMGRVKQQAKPTEVNASWVPTGDDAAGWVFTHQQYDWQGRPTLTTLPDGATTETSYGGCGCAGGEVTTVRDERGRRKRYTKDALGRLRQVSELNWDQTLYADTTYYYNARDQLVNINQAGQWRGFAYDGYGRLSARDTPEQGVTTYSYNRDDTLQATTDARGATMSFIYNGRDLVTNINYTVPAGVGATGNVSYSYDAAGNRTWMSNGSEMRQYAYDQLSRLTHEDIHFPGLNANWYRLSYQYNLAGQLTRVTNPWNAQAAYTHDAEGRVTNVYGTDVNGVATYMGVQNYALNLRYRAFGGLKEMTYGNSHPEWGAAGERKLLQTYDNRMRLVGWHSTYVMAWSYGYQNFGENGDRVTYAQSHDPSLSRSYQYDHVGRLQFAHSGVEARMHVTGQPNDGGSLGPYSQHTYFDVWGNVTRRLGWGGNYGTYTDQSQAYDRNRRVGLEYDAAGNLTFDGARYTYDATGQQTNAAQYPAGWGGYANYSLQQGYNGDRLRVKKVDNGVATYYLRSSILGGEVLAEMDTWATWQRGYVYLHGQLLVVQSEGLPKWVHQDPVTKSQRLTDFNQNVKAVVDTDPWGGETNRSQDSWRQPRKYTTYERDGNGNDQAMFRQYHSYWQRFDQPDPDDGSYNMADPQSLNRYAYVQNDPVNFVDPTGLNMAGPNTRYTNLDPMGVAYYVDGMLSDAHTAWGLIESGAGIIESHSVEGLTVINHYLTGGDIDGRQFVGQTVHFFNPGGALTQERPELERRLSHDTKNYDRWNDCFRRAAAEQLGIAEILTGLANWPVEKPRMPTFGGRGRVSTFTNPLSMFGHNHFRGMNLPFKILGTNRPFGVAGRLAPFVGVGLAAYDIEQIRRKTNKCYDSGK